MKEAKLTIEEISKNFVSYWILLLATFLIKCDSLAVSCESLIGKQISHRWQGVYGKRKWYKGHASAYVVQIWKQLTCSYNVAKYSGEDLNLLLNLLDNTDKVIYSRILNWVLYS